MGKVIVAIAGAIPAKLVFWVDDGVLENPTSSMNLQVKLPFCSGVSQPAMFSSGVRFTFDTIQRALSSLMLRPERNASHILRLYKHYEKHRKTNTKEHLVLKNIENKGIASRESFQETLVFALPWNWVSRCFKCKIVLNRVLGQRQTQAILNLQSWSFRFHVHVQFSKACLLKACHWEPAAVHGHPKKRGWLVMVTFSYITVFENVFFWFGR